MLIFTMFSSQFTRISVLPRCRCLPLSYRPVFTTRYLKCESTEANLPVTGGRKSVQIRDVSQQKPDLSLVKQLFIGKMSPVSNINANYFFYFVFNPLFSLKLSSTPTGCTLKIRKHHSSLSSLNSIFSDSSKMTLDSSKSRMAYSRGP